MSAAAFIKDAALCEEHASHQGFLQAWGPISKTIAFFALLLCVISLKSPLLISWIYAVCLLLAVMSGIPLVFSC